MIGKLDAMKQKEGKIDRDRVVLEDLLDRKIAAGAREIVVETYGFAQEAVDAVEAAYRDSGWSVRRGAFWQDVHWNPRLIGTLILE